LPNPGGGLAPPDGEFPVGGGGLEFVLGVEPGFVVVGDAVVGATVVKPLVEVGATLCPLVENGPKNGLPVHGTAGAGKSSQ
jgi:hypothetical protein